jgi:tRNA-specific 2-thiouridylase
VYCNRAIKFGVFLDGALGMGMDYLATGHYARIERDTGSGRWLLQKGIDTARDQSYFLYSLGQNHLSRALFPLGSLRKAEVREIAREQRLHNAAKSDSQDICFIPDGKYAAFIEAYTGKNPLRGSFTDSRGNYLGEHKGVIHYTIGQRKGLGVSSQAPLYVQKILPGSNTVVLGGHDELFSRTLTARGINLIPMERIDCPTRVTAKIRYRHSEQPATIHQLDDDTIHVEFDTPQRAITRGQAVVFYDGDTVIGGGTIE